MKEYEELQHMEQITEPEANSSINYFIPHHAVIKETSSTTKVRVVFDASCKTTSGISLNDISIVGPTVQSSLMNKVLRFRSHTFVITADIEKMYRQINIKPEQHNLQLILWRNNPNENIKIFQLKTVTYGTASAPYLATRTLNQLAIDEREKFAKAAQIVQTDFYVDDVMTGASSFQEAQQIVHDLRNLTQLGGFHLRKWCSNHPQLLKDIPAADIEQSVCNIDQEQSVKTLGLIWNPNKDIFQFSFNNQQHHHNLTKRTILSAIGQIFDPLGLIGPVIVLAKLLMQKLWICKIGWDDTLPDEITKEWMAYKNGLHLLAKLEIPRCVISSSPETKYEIHGFSDASEVAYGACVYLCSINPSQNATA
ncbi:uncharacterized protein LOC111063008 [Nilaparvata lugens]|uniref:uncharacterized protein LOC111063008 n=1 Tax=Nilaparvata lugens TaxID=108931 RepID=UPI00193D0574|nr:uncharacterized protein LOC111063008 [Nilaparvata lugens]